MNISFFSRVWAWVKWPLLVLLVLFIVFFIWSFYLGRNAVLTSQAVAKIHANRLTWPDINGTLPAQPDPVENNATLAGVDANNNGIRDDVERAIYNAYKNNEKLAIAELQYAKELQMEFTDVWNSPTLVAVMQEESRGYLCIPNDSGPKEVEGFVFNTNTRKQFREDLYNKYYIGWGIPNVTACDISA